MGAVRVYVALDLATLETYAMGFSLADIEAAVTERANVKVSQLSAWRAIFAAVDDVKRWLVCNEDSHTCRCAIRVVNDEEEELNDGQLLLYDYFYDELYDEYKGKYRELQKEAKELGIPAKQTYPKLVAALARARVRNM